MKLINFILLLLLLPFQGIAQKDTLADKTYAELTTLMDEYSSPLTFDLIEYYHQKAEIEANQEEQFAAKSKFIEASIWNRKFEAAEDSLPVLRSMAKKYEFDSRLTESLFQIGRAYFFQGIWGKAIDIYNEALRIAEKTNDRKFQQKLLVQIGYIRSTIGDHDQALRLQKRSLELLKNSDFDSIYKESTLGANYYFLSRTFANKKQKDSARFYIDLALLTVEQPIDSCTRKAYLRTKAEIDILHKDFDAAENNLKKAMLLCRPLEKIDSLVFYGNYGQLYLAKKEYKKAQVYLREGLDIYKVKEEEEGFMLDHYKLLAKAYKHNGEIEKSNFYLEKYIFTTEEFIKIQDTINQSFKRQEIQNFKAELDAITEEKNEKETYLNYLFLGASLIILILLILLLRFYRNKKQNEARFEVLMQKVNAANKPDEITDTKDEVLEEKTTTDVPAETKLSILEGLKKLEEKEYYLKQECNSYNVARKINTNTSYLSKVINSHFDKNFNTYINDLRINYAILRLKNDVIFRSYSIQSIAEELGYKSADSFSKYFKQNTGLNPSFYIKEIKNIT